MGIVRTFPKQTSSTSAGSRLLFSRTNCKMRKHRASRGVSLSPPFFALVSGVLIANVMTISSGFFWVLIKVQLSAAGCLYG